MRSRGVGHPQHCAVVPKFSICVVRLGKGAYGIVWMAKEKRSGRVVALKKCFDAFRNGTDAQRAYREIMYLQRLAGHDNIVRMQHVSTEPPRRGVGGGQLFDTRGLFSRQRSL